MNRPLHTRIASLVVALWVALFMGETEWLVRCAAHGAGAAGHAAGAHGAAPVQAATDHRDGHAGHAAHAGHDQAAQSPAPPTDQEGHGCSCPGPGCCPPGIAGVPGSTGQFAQVVAVHEAAAFATLERLDSAPDHLLPFATAPPLARLAPAA